MNPIIMSLVLLASILFVFFIVPVISLIGFTIILGEADHTPMKKMIIPPGMPISIKKVLHKGQIIWVDAK